MLESLVPSWWNCLERIKRCGLVGDVSLGMGFEVSKTQSILVESFSLYLLMSTCQPSATAPEP